MGLAHQSAYKLMRDKEIRSCFIAYMETGNENSGEIEFGDELDLHHFAPRDTAILVEYFLRDAHARGLTRVRIIHGKGKSVKKREVYALLDRYALVSSYGDDGHNWGSTVVFLTKKDNPDGV